MELRCQAALHVRYTDQGLIEVACKSRFCGKKPGNVVLHRFNPETGVLVETLRFKTPPKPSTKERKADDID